MAQALAIAFGWGIAWVCTIVLTLCFRKLLKIEKMSLLGVLWRTAVVVVVVQAGLMVTLLVRDPNIYNEFPRGSSRLGKRYHAYGLSVGLAVVFPAVKLLFGVPVKKDDLDNKTKVASAVGYTFLAYVLQVYAYFILGEWLDWWWIEEPAV